uniref:Protein unc-79 homolog n=1 Tax=Phallusia mammillata TaxID=59560 RepID=A0A6F9DGG6_9ASCI|nr:protein unc-79 homolog [Phallusia mammillata]
MVFKKNLWSDIMTVISFSDGSVKVNAVQLLFHYWPQLHPSTTMGHKLDMQCVYENISCENLQCKSAPKTNAAVTMLLDPGKSAYLSEKAPPLYLCHSCSQNTMTENSNVTFHDVLLPMEYIGYNCENKHCISTDPTATVTLCSSQCERRFVDGRSEGSLSNFQRNNFFWHILENKGIRYCEECYSNIHLILGDLVTQMSPSCAWNLSELESNVIVSTVISLLLEPASKVNPKLKTSKVRLFSDSDSTEQLNVTGSYPCLGCKVNIGLLIESQTLSHFGVWILITLCPPQQSTNQESATRLLAAVVAWYASNSRLESDELGNRLESLKQQYLESWLLEMSSIHFKAFLSVLLPHPSAECRATGHWDAIKPMWRHYQDALSLITCLSSYSIIRKEMWDCLIPAWMVALSSNLCPTELKQLKPVLNALLDVDLSPLPFDAEKVFEFVLKHFHSSQVWQHQQALSWLQIFCDVDVIIPLNIMLDAFNSADECLGFSMANESVMNEKNLVLLFDTGGKLTDTEVETIFKQSRHSTITTVGSAFEDMNVSCSNKCSTDNEHTKQYSRVKISTHRQNANEQCNVISNRVSCYVEILEVVYHQMILQNQPKHGGVCNGEASKIIKLLNILLTHIVVKIENQPLQFSAEGGMKMDTFHQFFKFFMMILDYILPTGFPEWVGINGNCRWNVGSQRKDQTEQDDMCVNLENFQQFCFPVQLVFKLVKVSYLDVGHEIFN